MARLTNRDIIETDLNILIQDDKLSLLQLQNAYRCKMLYNILCSKPYIAADVRGIWIQGPTGVGKTHYARHHFGSDIFKYYNNRSWNGYNG